MDEDWMYHVGKKDGVTWSDKDSYTAIRKGLKSSKDVENSPLSIAGQKERLFYRRKKETVEIDSDAVIEIKDPKEIEALLSILKRKK